MRELEGKNAIVTGANRGIGNAIVYKFAENGCNIWACARKKNDVFEAAMHELSRKQKVEIIPIYFELTKEKEIRDGLKKIYQTKKSIDILVNAAGVTHNEVLHRTSMNIMREIYEINYFAPVNLCQIAVQRMMRQRSGTVINLASISGLDIRATNCSYGTSKAALIHFTKVLAAEVASMGIRVNAIAPGATDTDMMKEAGEKAKDALLERCAMNRMALPKEIAEIALFLVSDRASFVNGQVIRIDGGSK